LSVHNRANKAADIVHPRAGSRVPYSMKTKTDSATPSPAERTAILSQARNAKMARSAHAYVRGNTVKFYEWLGTDSSAGLPSGPPVWICGDCHVGNLGPLADAEGQVAIQIRDLDQTVIGNPAHDLVRLGLSLAMAARGADLPGVTTAKMLEEMVAGYREALGFTVSRATIAERQNKAVGAVMRRAMSRKWHHLANERIADVRPAIPRGDKFWDLSGEERHDIEKLVSGDDVRALVTALNGRKPDAKIAVLDAAYWVKGCSSLGRGRYAVLLGVGKKQDPDKGGICFLDIKEATAAAAPRAARTKMPDNDAERVVTGARALSPHLGQRMVAGRVRGKPVVIRELMPQDLKLEIDSLSRDDAVMVARYLSGVVGHAHARQMTPADRKSWRAELTRRHNKTLEAPSWLWTSVVDLVGSHEIAYLEHCRRHAA
jgi:uncharacterized protein (DUF2252 family)